MKPQQPRNKVDMVLNLMCFSGMALFICTIPEGLVLGLQARYQLHLEWRDAFAVSGIMMLMTIVTGFILLRLGIYFLKKRRTTEDKPGVN